MKYLLALLMILMNEGLAHGDSNLTFETGMTIVVMTDRHDDKGHEWKCMSDSECEAEERALESGKGE